LRGVRNAAGRAQNVLGKTRSQRIAPEYAANVGNNGVLVRWEEIAMDGFDETRQFDSGFIEDADRDMISA